MTRIAKTTLGTAAILLVLSLVSGPQAAVAQEGHVVEPGELDEAAAAHRTEDQARRDAVLDVLEHERVQEVAAEMDVDLVEARDAARTLEGKALARAAETARELDRALSGGVTTITLSTTALVLIALLLVVLIAD